MFPCNVTLSAPTTDIDVTVDELTAKSDARNVALGCSLEAYRLGLAKGVQFHFDDPITHMTVFAATMPNASPSMRLEHLAR
jgi:2-dehydropantoate 2-reductase